MTENYKTMNLVDLRLEAKKRGLTGTGTLKKAELIEVLENEDRKNEAIEKESLSETDAAAPKATVNAAKETMRNAADFTSEISVGSENKETRTTERPAKVIRTVGSPKMTAAESETQENASGTGHANGYGSRPVNGILAGNGYENGTSGNGSFNRQNREQEHHNPVPGGHLDSGIVKEGILEIPPESGFGFIRCDNFLPGENDVYVSPAQIRRFNMKTGDMVRGNVKVKTGTEKYSALLYVSSINGLPPEAAARRPRFEDLTPVFPHERLRLEIPSGSISMRIVDLLSPIGKGQRGMIVSQPKAGKTTLLKQIATSIIERNPDMEVIILLIDERPEEVTDMKESIHGKNVQVIYSTFDELPEKHKRVSEMVIEHAKRMVEHKKDVVILLDSITRLARAYNLTCQSSGRTLSGGLDPAALHMPKKFFGAARCMKEGGSLTILATALVDTGSRMDDVVFEEFKGTGNMELVLDRSLSERRIFPAIDLPRSSTRRDDLLYEDWEREANDRIRKAFGDARGDEAVTQILDLFKQTKSNREFADILEKRFASIRR